jgi:hypothetical protein
VNFGGRNNGKLALEFAKDRWHSAYAMSTREALIQEILKQPDSLLRELQHYLAFLIELERKESKGNSHSQSAWPEGYFEKTAGAFANEPFERPPQLPFEKREEW